MEGENNGLLINERSYLEVQFWLEGILKVKIENLASALRDGKLLLKLLDELFPGSIDQSRFGMDLLSEQQAVDNVGLFVQQCRTLGVPETSLFLASDLVHYKNMDLVVSCLLHLKQLTLQLSSIPQLTPVSQIDASVGGGVRSRTENLNSPAPLVFTPLTSKKRSQHNFSSLENNSIHSQKKISIFRTPILWLSVPHKHKWQWLTKYILMPTTVGVCLGFGLKSAKHGLILFADYLRK